jgi:hypothetical protein
MLGTRLSAATTPLPLHQKTLEDRGAQFTKKSSVETWPHWIMKWTKALFVSFCLPNVSSSFPKFARVKRLSSGNPIPSSERRFRIDAKSF